MSFGDRGDRELASRSLLSRALLPRGRRLARPAAPRCSRVATNCALVDGTTAAALRSARGVPQASFAAGSFRYCPPDQITNTLAGYRTAELSDSPRASVMPPVRPSASVATAAASGEVARPASACRVGGLI